MALAIMARSMFIVADCPVAMLMTSPSMLFFLSASVNASAMSSTYMKSLVCLPLPYMIGFLSCSSASMNLVIAPL